jgi:hypothetical protein
MRVVVALVDPIIAAQEAIYEKSISWSFVRRTPKQGEFGRIRGMRDEDVRRLHFRCKMMESLNTPADRTF